MFCKLAVVGFCSSFSLTVLGAVEFCRTLEAVCCRPSVIGCVNTVKFPTKGMCDDEFCIVTEDGHTIRLTM